MSCGFGGGKIYENILECIGNTPMVRLNRIPKDYGLQCEIYAKCEFLNPGGSIKDRISYSMVHEAEKAGVIKPGTRLIEPTSGNTGIGVSLTAAVRGYACTIVTPDKNSDEKMNTMHLLGSDIVKTPSKAPIHDPENFVAVTKRILDETSNGISLDQYSNMVNPDTHYKDTAEEILRDVGYVDMFVMGAGTGGTVSGVARRLKQVCPDCIVVAVDPKGSVMFEKTEYELFFVEGIGGDFIPDVLDKTVIDKVIHTNDYQSFKMSREIIRKEGLLCGGSSGAITYSAIQVIKEMKIGAGKKVLVILPDGIRNYMTKFVSDQWMEAHLFKNPPEQDFPWWNKLVGNLEINMEVPMVRESDSFRDALIAMGSDHTVAFVINNNGFLQGVVSKDSLRSSITNQKKKSSIFTDNIMKHLMKNYHKIVLNKGNPTIGLSARILDITPFVVAVEDYQNDNNNNAGFIPKGIITSDIVMEYIIKHES